MNFKRSIIRFLLVLIYLILLPGVLLAFFYFLRMFLFFPFRLAFFLLGSFFGIFLDKYLLHRFPKIEIFIHEFTHAFTAILFFRKINKFVLSDNAGGFVKYSGGRGGLIVDDIIGLAPYCLPFFMLFLVLFQPLISLIFFFCIRSLLVLLSVISCPYLFVISNIVGLNVCSQLPAVEK
jgi:hypothetical protein